MKEFDFKKELLITCTHNTPISSAFYYDNFNSLSEGLIVTYPIQKVKEYVDDLLNVPGNEYITMIDNDKFRIKYYNTERNKEIVSKALSLCGYPLSKETIDGDYIEQCYIPKYSGDVTDIIHNKMQFIMHISPLYYKDNILQKGFIPKTKHSDFQYNDRIYFFVQNTPPQEILYQIQLFNSKLKNKTNNNIYCLFYVDVKKMPEDVKFYVDTTYGFGVYTMQNIRPDVIYNVQEIDLNKFNG